MKYIYVLFEFKHTEFFTSHGGYLLNTTLLSSWCRIFSSRSRSREIRIYLISKFLFIVVIAIAILLWFSNLQAAAKKNRKFQGKTYFTLVSNSYNHFQVEILLNFLILSFLILQSLSINFTINIYHLFLIRSSHKSTKDQTTIQKGPRICSILYLK